MNKIYDKSLFYHLQLIFKPPFRKKFFQIVGKKPNVVPVHKKDSKNLLKNYRLIRFLPVFAKIFKQSLIIYVIITLDYYK